MTIQIIEDHAEKELLRAIENARADAMALSVMLCQFSHIKTVATPHMLMPILNDILKDQDTSVYFCHDGDAVVCWKGYHDHIMKGLLTTLTMVFKDRFNNVSREQVFRFFEPFEQENELIAICRGKIIQRDIAGNRSPVAAATPPRTTICTVLENLSFNDAQKQSLADGIAMRKRRRGVEILVVEDQGFSRKLLTGMLEKHYRCREAETAEEALKLYATYTPDLCFLDIELPDASGHALARLFRTHDPDSHLIMVTANKIPQDVDMAMKNAVHGFIYKPFSKNRIFSIVENVIKRNARTA